MERLTQEEVTKWLRFSLRTVFTFDGQLYEPLQGTPMGSPISGVITEAVLRKLESIIFPEYRPRFWTRYVDDTFVIVKRNRKSHLQDRLNSVSPEVQFTMEDEENGHLPFLDVLVTRKEDGGLETMVSRKPTNTDNILHADSNHPMEHKISALCALFRRIETHCSTPAAKAEELRTVLRIGRANGYTSIILNRCRSHRVAAGRLLL